jgi:uncharacterized protein YjbI with pentapeptide repeats
MILHHPKSKPEPWPAFRRHFKTPLMRPFLATEYVFEWAVYWLSNWSFLETLEYLSSLSLLIAVVFYFADHGNRIKQRHYQAWQVINTAQGKGGSGGRIDALQELDADNVALIGVDLSDAFLQGVRLDKSKLTRANFHNADVRNSFFAGADLSDATLAGANFRGADFHGAVLRGTVLTDADLSGANLQDADLNGANLEDVDLHGADLRNLKWNGIISVNLANLAGVKNAPPDFMAWAMQNGAMPNGTDQGNPNPAVNQAPNPAPAQNVTKRDAH